jgi:hypothetical protein
MKKLFGIIILIFIIWTFVKWSELFRDLFASY